MLRNYSVLLHTASPLLSLSRKSHTMFLLWPALNASLYLATALPPSFLYAAARPPTPTLSSSVVRNPAVSKNPPAAETLSTNTRLV